MRNQILPAVLLTLALIAFGSAQPAELSFDKAKIDQFFNRLADKNKAMGTLTIARDGKVIYTRSIGYSQINATERKPLTSASRFRIGSITKMFTAALILKLVEEKKLNLTDTLDKFFPQIPNAKKITIAHILTHRSGIPNARRDPSSGKTPVDPITQDEMLALIVKAPPDFDPDAKLSYSNSGYQVLGLIVEKVTGKPYADVLKEKITSKTGLADTYVATGSIDVSKNESLTYINTGTDWKQGLETHPSILFSAGAIVSTPNDLAKFIHALFEGKIVSTESLALMRTIKAGDPFGMMEPFSFAGRIFYGHTGGADNYGAWLAYLPEEKLALAYTTNAKVYPVKEIVSGVMDIYYNVPFQIPTFETIAVSAEVLDKYVGVYSSPSVPVKFTITRQGTTLFIQPGSESPAALEATAQDKFQLLGGAIVFEFDAGKNQMIQRRGGQERVFTKEK